MQDVVRGLVTPGSLVFHPCIGFIQSGNHLWERGPLLMQQQVGHLPSVKLDIVHVLVEEAFPCPVDIGQQRYHVVPV